MVEDEGDRVAFEFCGASWAVPATRDNHGPPRHEVVHACDQRFEEGDKLFLIPDRGEKVTIGEGKPRTEKSAGKGRTH